MGIRRLLLQKKQVIKFPKLMQQHLHHLFQIKERSRMMRQIQNQHQTVEQAHLLHQAVLVVHLILIPIHQTTVETVQTIHLNHQLIRITTLFLSQRQFIMTLKQRRYIMMLLQKINLFTKNILYVKYAGKTLENMVEKVQIFIVQSLDILMNLKMSSLGLNKLLLGKPTMKLLQSDKLMMKRSLRDINAHAVQSNKK